MTDTSYKTIDQQVGLLGGTVLLTGTVIGNAIFLLPGELIGDAGPSIVLALMLTAIPMVFAVLALLQLGGAIPVAGGLYVYGSRLIGPFWGFLAVWLMVPTIWAVFLFTAIGFADFVRFFVDVPAEMLMGGVLTVFLLLNLRGITLVAQAQLLIVGGILLGILAFTVPGAGHVDPANYSPMFPEGVEPFVVAVVSLYIPFQGFAMIIELGEELEDPVKNIPRVLALGMAIAVGLSVALVAVFAGVADYRTLGGYEDAAVATAATEFLPTWAAGIVAMGAVFGAFAALNATLTSYSRTIMRAARDELLPQQFARIHPVSDVPYWAILLLGLPPILFVPISPDPVPLSIFLALVLLFGNGMAGVALWRLPTVFPQRYEYSIYQLPMPLLKATAVCTFGFSSLFWLATMSELPWIVGVLVGLIAVGYGVYRYRIWVHHRRDVDLRARMALLHKHERVGGEESD